MKLASFWGDAKGAGRVAIQELLHAARENKGDLIAGAIGAAAGGGFGYGVSKRWGGKPSVEERLSKKMLDSHEKRVSELKAKGKKPGYVEDTAGATAKMYDTAAHHMARYPVRGGAGIMAPIGASTAVKLKRHIMEVARSA